MHLIKEESFIVLSGMAEVTLGDKCHNLSPGAVLVVERGVKHSLFSKEGAVIEEISTSHIGGDSYYTDSKISGESERKTETSFWNH
jgi:N-acetylneuraminate synthase